MVQRIKLVEKEMSKKFHGNEEKKSKMRRNEN